MVFLLSLLIPQLTWGFSDINNDYVYKNAVDYTREQGIFQGYEDDTFRPFNPINRAEFTKIIMVFTGQFEPDEPCEPKKTLYDVTPDQWFFPYICQAVNKDIIDGYPNKFFLPGNYVQAAEAAKIITLSLGADKIEADPWYEPYVIYLEDRNALPSDVSHLNQELHRGQIAEVVYRLNTGYVGLNKSAFYSEPGEEFAVLAEDTVAQGIIDFIEAEGVFQETIAATFYPESAIDYSQSSQYERQANFQDMTDLSQAVFNRSARMLYGDEDHYRIDVVDTARPPNLDRMFYLNALLSRFGDLDLITIANDRWFGTSPEFLDTSIHFKNYEPNSIVDLLKSQFDQNLSIKQLKSTISLYSKDPFISLAIEKAKKDVHLSSLNESDIYAIPFTVNTKKLSTLLQDYTQSLPEAERVKAIGYLGGDEQCAEFSCILQANGKIFASPEGKLVHYQTELYLKNGIAGIFNNAIYRHDYEVMGDTVYNRPDPSVYLTVDFSTIVEPTETPEE